RRLSSYSRVVFFNDPAPTELYTLSLHELFRSNGARIREADATWNGDLGQYVYDDGWHYDALANAVVLTGTAVPDFNADVKVWYLDRKSTRLNSSHVKISYAVFCLKKKKRQQHS